MSNINYISSNLKSQCIEKKNEKKNISKRYCKNCNKEYTFDNVICEYPERFQDPIKVLWNNPDIKFYCSYCYLLKLIKLIKKNKKNQF